MLAAVGIEGRWDDQPTVDVRGFTVGTTKSFLSEVLEVELGPANYFSHKRRERRWTNRSSLS